MRRRRKEIRTQPGPVAGQVQLLTPGANSPVSLLKALVPNKTWPFKALNYVSAELLKSV